jgi:hypothetical protein
MIQPLSWWASAYHEAAHCVAARRYGAPVTSMRIYATGDGLTGGECYIDSDALGPWWRAMISLAGPAAEGVFLGVSDYSRIMLGPHGSGDLTVARDAVGEARLNDLAKPVLCFVKSHWAMIEAVARELYARKELGYDEIVRLAESLPIWARGGFASSG